MRKVANLRRMLAGVEGLGEALQVNALAWLTGPKPAMDSCGAPNDLANLFHHRITP